MSGGTPRATEIREALDVADQLSDDELLEILDTRPGEVASRYGAESLNGEPTLRSGRPRLLTDAELGQLPPLEWDIDGVLPTGGLSYLIGLRGSGKTLLALDWSAHIALGRRWYGRTVKQGMVLYVAAEGSRSLHSRLDCWKFHHQIPVTQETGIQWFPHRLTLLNPASVGAFIAEVAASDVTPRAIVIDTAARCTQGAKENDSDGMGRALDAVDRLREALGTGVLLVAHPARDGGDNPRGHSSQDGAADAIWSLREQDGARLLTCSKLKDGDESAEFPLVLCPVGSSVLLLPAGQAPVQSSLTPGQRRVLVTIRDIDHGTGVSAAVIQEASGVAKSSVYHILKKLHDQRLVAAKRSKWSVTPAGLVQLSSEVSSG